MNVLLANASAVGCMMGSVWVLSLIKRDASVVDAFWGLGFVLVAWVSFSFTRSSPALLTAILVSIWGVRLAAYIAARNHGQPEDFRYKAMREKVGASFPLVSLFTVFGLQGVLLWVVAIPVQMLAWEHDVELVGIRVAHVPGAVVWCAGLAFEAIGDAQLAAWKRDPANRGKVMDQGLWRYSRHPNYFGDFCVWWGIFGVCVASGAPIWTAVGPALMSFLLLRVSGVAHLEKSMRTRPGYEDYIRRTSAFFPRPPR